MAANLSQKSLKKTLADMDKDSPYKRKKGKKEEDPDFVDSEWRRLMNFQRGMR